MDREPVHPLFAELYPRLQALAGSMLRGERVGHTLESAALVNEAFTRLRGDTAYSALTSGRLFGLMATAMRHVLVDHGRARATTKRGSGWQRVGLVDEPSITDEGHVHADVVVQIHRLLDELAATGPMGARQVRVFELRAFLGMDFAVIAEALGVSVRLVFDDWVFARTWILKRLDDD